MQQNELSSIFDNDDLVWKNWSFQMISNKEAQHSLVFLRS